jgi:glycosyltransferase involved in cell wall biosynthesis
VTSTARRFAVTFVTPHQRMLAGGVYAIHQFARHLTSMMNVNLVVLRNETEPLPGVSVVSSERLMAESTPDADATVLYINAKDSGEFFDLPASKGERLLLYQGHSELDSERVKSRLELGLRVLAVSSWLVDEARRLGSRPTHTPYGLDRSIFFAGPPTESRAPIVSMMCSPVDWKGKEDGVAALATVKKERPDVELQLFGRSRPEELPSTFFERLSRTEVADLMRRSAVFVCPSWEEGFGLPGLEAIACGAALATTDTKGSRDYAIDGETALVTPPRDPQRLAESILRLLNEVELRRSLCAAGMELARNRFSDWPQAAAMMGRALLNGR